MQPLGLDDPAVEFVRKLERFRQPVHPPRRVGVRNGCEE
jgi:hypothetical protein